MSIDAILELALGTEVIFLLGLITLTLGHALWYQQHTRKAGQLLARSIKIIMAMLDDSPPTTDDIRFLTSMPLRLKIKLFNDIALNIGGEDKSILRALAQEIGLIAESERLCKSRFWSKRLFGARLLTMLNTGESIIPSLLGDKSPYVRTQAAEWAGDHPNADVIPSVLNMLCDPDFSCRFAAKDALIRMDTEVVTHMAAYLDNGDKCGTEAALEVAANVADHRLLLAGIRHCENDSPKIRKLATSLLGEIGGSDASKIVAQMLKDDDPAVRAEAARMTGRLGDWTTAATLAELLNDPDWTVRRNVCAALASFGAPGLLILRHNSTQVDEEAAELAEQALSMHKFSVQSAHGLI